MLSGLYPAELRQINADSTLGEGKGVQQLVSPVMDKKALMEGFISSYGKGHSLDPRTKKAYRMDLEHFYSWLDSSIKEGTHGSGAETERNGTVKPGIVCWEDRAEAYLEYLAVERKLSASTICRKNRVLGYYLSYLADSGLISGSRPLKQVKGWEKRGTGEPPASALLSRNDADALFQAMEREYDSLESEFRKRVCLRDMVMMGLLFYHRITISELLRIEAADYDKERGTIQIRKKRGEVCIIRLYSQSLRQKMELWLKERKVFLQKEEGCAPLFLSKYGKGLSMEMFIQIFDKYRKLAGIEKKLTPKDLKESSMKQYAKELMMERCSGY